MDIARPDISRKKRQRRLFLIAVSIVLLVLVTVGISRLKPALFTVDRSVVLPDTVKRGEMLREVRGSGTLVPEEIRWITAISAGRVENILLLPGVKVEADTVLIELTNPELVQAAFDAESQWHAAEAQLERLKVQLESERLTLQSLIATLKSDLTLSKIEAEADAELFKDGLVASLTAKRSRARADELESRYQLEQSRLEISAKSARAQVLVQDSEVEKLRKQHQLKIRQVDALKVRAGIAGVLQRLGDDRPLQVGQQLGIGANIARIANPTKLKAEIKILETQARDIQHDQVASIDTRNGVIPGHVVRIDPAVQNGTRTVDVKLDGALPKGAVPDLTVDGIITLERLDDVLYVGRPVNGQSDSLVSLFKIVDGGRRAIRVPVKLGRSSVTTIEVIQGLEVGDQVIVSDTSQWDRHDEIRLN